MPHVCRPRLFIPEGDLRVDQQRARVAPAASEIALAVDKAPAAPPKPRRDREREERRRLERSAIDRVLESSGNVESEKPVALPARGDGERVPSQAPLVRRKPKKRKKKQRDESPSEISSPRWKKNPSIDFEAWKPAGLAVATLVIFVCVAVSTVPPGFVASTYVWNKLGFMLTVFLICTPVLFVGSIVMSISYGEVKTVLFNVAGIILTQAWAEDLLTLQPLPYVPTFGAWAVTLFLCMNAFDQEGLEAQASMCLVRGTHTAVYWLLFVKLLTVPPDSAQAVPNEPAQPPAAVQQAPAEKEPADKADEAQRKEIRKDESKGSEPDKGPRPVAQGRTAEDRSLALTQKFGDALVAEDYAWAYDLMSPKYQKTVTLEEFSALHRQAQARFGKPRKATAGLGDEDAASLKGPEFERFQNVPPRDRIAWTYANLALELDQGLSVRCYDCWLLLVKSGKAVRVGAFEYEACE
jgi:hypothetical protein